MMVGLGATVGNTVEASGVLVGDAVLGTAVDGARVLGGAVDGARVLGAAVDDSSVDGVALQTGHVVTVDPGGVDAKENVPAPSSWRIAYTQESHVNVFVSSVSQPVPVPSQAADNAVAGHIGVTAAAPGP